MPKIGIPRPTANVSVRNVQYVSKDLSAGTESAVISAGNQKTASQFITQPSVKVNNGSRLAPVDTFNAINRSLSAASNKGSTGVEKKLNGCKSSWPSVCPGNSCTLRHFTTIGVAFAAATELPSLLPLTCYFLSIRHGKQRARKEPNVAQLV